VPGAVPKLFTFASGLKLPHDIVLHTIGSTRYLYIGESNQVTRAIYVPKDTVVRARTVIVSNLPDADTPGLGGQYGHPLKNLAIDKNHKLYVSIGSSCNACLSDGNANPVRASIYKYNADGTGGVLFARGLRNAEGLAFVPGTTTLWAAVNNRDNIKYPFNDSTGNYGKVIPAYVDDHPPDEFTNVRSGGDYGWPFCNPNPDTPSGMDNMPFDVDYDFRSQGVNCATKDRIAKGIQAHSAPLGLRFLQGTNFRAAYVNGVAIALHGSWNRTVPTGYKVIYFPWNSSTQRPGTQIDLVRGWHSGGTRWGRPVDVTMDGNGGLLISDNYSGTIYRLY
jgi:glucose/arabinose dehydrogenase